MKIEDSAIYTLTPQYVSEQSACLTSMGPIDKLYMYTSEPACVNRQWMMIRSTHSGLTGILTSVWARCWLLIIFALFLSLHPIERHK